MSTPVWSTEHLTDFLRRPPAAPPPAIFAFYNSLWDAIVLDPAWMLIPVHDHLVHRGDGVFETLLAEEGAIYNLHAHLDRLERSADRIGLSLPFARPRLIGILQEVFTAAGRSRALARLLLGRGPGGFSVDPAESPQSSLYVAIYAAPPAWMDGEKKGARAVSSAVPPKSGGMANIKTCNYLPNVLMKAEARRAGVDFSLGVDAEGFLTESATENVAAVDVAGALIVPPAPHHLAGTTLARVKALAAEAGMPVREEPLRAEELFGMREIWVVGTTAYVMPLLAIDGKTLPSGPLARQMAERLRRDIRENTDLRTAFPLKKA